MTGTMKSDRLPRLFMGLLIAVHLGLGLWGLMGFAEMIFPAVPWPEISNPKFTDTILVLQWALVLVAAALFLGGTWARWAQTPRAMLVIYLLMGALCAVQNLFYLDHATRFLAVALEYAAYTVILLFLFRAAYARAFFGRT